MSCVCELQAFIVLNWILTNGQTDQYKYLKVSVTDLKQVNVFCM